MVFTGVDLFRTKLAEYGEQRTIEIIKGEWPHYKGDGTFDNVLSFFLQQFQECAASKNIKLKGPYVVSAMDGPSVLETFQLMMEHIEHIPPLSTLQ
jgi:hypothetical protein